MMTHSLLSPMYVWCLLGYMFLIQGEPTSAILASMASITTVWFAQKAGRI